MPPTQTLAQFVVGTKTDALPAWAMHEAKRTLINVLGIALSASVQTSARTLEAWAHAEGGNPRATVIGSGWRTNLEHAALLNGYFAHLQDYDDTHLPTILHPSAPTWPAVLAAAELTGARGRDVLAAFVLGAETACRVAMSTHPWHYDRGWHITGTAGVFGAAAGAGRLLGLTATQMTHALGTAATQAASIREVLGSTTKALHPAKAASDGLRSALWANAGITSSLEILAGRRGFWAVLSEGKYSEAALLDGLGERWELRSNGLKPYANGVVAHPLQDAMIAIRQTHHVKPEQVQAIRARVHPLVLELMNRPDPSIGMEGKFSFQHCAAAALVDGAGHDAQFTDAKVTDPVIAGVRARITATADASVKEEEVHVAVELTDGRTLNHHVPHATGSRGNPMTDAALEAKYHASADPVLGATQATRLLHAAWALDAAPDVREVATLMGIAASG